MSMGSDLERLTAKWMAQLLLRAKENIARNLLGQEGPSRFVKTCRSIFPSDILNPFREKLISQSPRISLARAG
jgi:hypothetical protein